MILNTRARHMPGVAEYWASRLVEHEIRHLLQRQTITGKPVNAQRHVRHALWASFVAGLLCSGILGVAEILYFGTDARNLTLFGSAAALLTLLEFWFLFRFGFRAAASLILRHAQALDPGHQQDLIGALSRAVLEIPEPNIRPFDLNPAKYVRKEQKFVLLILYRIKIMASNVIAKQLLKRWLLRSGLRDYAPLVAGPITGLWNCWVMSNVLEECLYRMTTRLAVEKLIQDVQHRPTSTDMQSALVLLVGCRITLFGYYHQGLDYLLNAWMATLPLREGCLGVLDDEEALFRSFEHLPSSERKRFQEIAACVFAFKRTGLTRREIQMLSLLGVEMDAIEGWKKRFGTMQDDRLLI